MPQQILVVFFIECALIFTSTLLLAQPGVLFGHLTEKMRSVYRAGGWVFLCLTFCWSVVLGSVLTLHSYYNF